MELILLPGNSKHNKEWIEKVNDCIREFFDSSHVHYYRHWKTDEEIIDIDYELNSLVNYLKNKKDYVLFAKSAGSFVVIKGIHDGKLKPKGCIFVGLPVLWAREHKINLDNWIERYSTKTSFIQNDRDPATSANSLRKYLEEKKVRNYEFHELKGNDHTYSDLDKLKQIISKIKFS